MNSGPYFSRGVAFRKIDCGLAACEYMTLPDGLRHYRNLAGLSLGQLAKAAGISKTHLWELEVGRTSNPCVETLAAIADALGVSPTLLFAMWLTGRRGAAALAPTLNDARTPPPVE